MKANELRIGNWIKGAYEFQIEEIKKDGIYDIYDPIPLTPKILEDISVKIKPYPYWKSSYRMENKLYCLDDESFMDNNCMFYTVWNGIYEYTYIIGGIFKSAICFDNDEMLEGVFKTKEVKYLHQIQNLYFDLNDVELKVNFHVETAN